DLACGLGATGCGGRDDALGRGRRAGGGQRGGDDGGERSGRRAAACELAETPQQVLAQSLPRTRQALAHGGVGQAQQGCDLARTLALAVVEQQDFAAVVGQCGDEFGRGLFALVLDQLLGGRGRWVGGQRDRDFRAFAVE